MLVRIGARVASPRGVRAWVRRSAEPDLEVEARLPCLEIRRREEAMILDVVLML